MTGISFETLRHPTTGKAPHECGGQAEVLAGARVRRGIRAD
jgi:hypothetical protein